MSRRNTNQEFESKKQKKRKKGMRGTWRIYRKHGKRYGKAWCILETGNRLKDGKLYGISTESWMRRFMEKVSAAYWKQEADRRMGNMKNSWNIWQIHVSGNEMNVRKKEEATKCMGIATGITIYITYYIIIQK